jgi:hypothetical protein
VFHKIRKFLYSEEYAKRRSLCSYLPGGIPRRNIFLYDHSRKGLVIFPDFEPKAMFGAKVIFHL